MNATQTKRCPYCGEEILAVALKCKHCHEDVSSGRQIREAGGGNVKAKDHPNYWTYTLVCILIPIVGVVLGIIGLTRSEKVERKLGEHALALSIVLMVAYWILGSVMLAMLVRR